MKKVKEKKKKKRGKEKKKAKYLWWTRKSLRSCTPFFYIYVRVQRSCFRTFYKNRVCCLCLLALFFFSLRSNRKKNYNGNIPYLLTFLPGIKKNVLGYQCIYHVSQMENNKKVIVYEQKKKDVFIFLKFPFSILYPFLFLDVL